MTEKQGKMERQESARKGWVPAGKGGEHASREEILLAEGTGNLS